MLKNHEVTTEAIVIGRAQAGEGSVRVFLYTKSAGLVRALATSAREERSKLRSHLQVGTYGTYNLVKGAHDWRVIGASDTQNTYFFECRNANGSFACARVLSVLRTLIHGEEPNDELFEALWNFLKTYPMLSEKEVVIAEHVVMVRILYALGYVPDQTHIPSLKGSDYTPQVMNELSAQKKELVKFINEALLASGLS